MEKKIPQNLPGYINLYSTNTGWLVRESEHYAFHYFPKSTAEQDIENIINRQEKAFNKIVSKLNLHPSFKIYYYLYPDPKIKESLMGGWGSGPISL